MLSCLLLFSAALPQETMPLRHVAVCRRAVCLGLCGTIVMPFAAHAAAVSSSSSLAVRRLEDGAAVLEDVLSRWKELTTDCKYGEFNRALLEAENKQALLKAASSTSKAETTVTVCRSSARLVRDALGSDLSPLNKIGKQLETPTLVQLVAEEDFEDFLKDSERLQQALSAADAAAYFSATGDFSAQTSFREGETPTTPNLDAARDSVREAQVALNNILRLLNREL